jgi:molecular chaperone GrpE
MKPVESAEQPEPVAPPDGWQAELQRLEHELEATRDQLLRVLADFDNYRRRIEREADSIGLAGKRDLILGLIHVMDSFDQAYSFSSDNTAALDGLRVIHRQLLGLLEAHDVRPFDSLGVSFDPEWHEAIHTVNAEEAGIEPGTIVQEFQKGYRWSEKLLRPARVQVAQ